MDENENETLVEDDFFQELDDVGEQEWRENDPSAPDPE